MDILRVLVVDDEPGMRHSVTRALRNMTVRLPQIEGETRLETATAESGEEALEILARETFDLVLLDHKLGGITGIEVLERLGPRAQDMRIIMITAFATIETAVRATRSGAYDFLAKPFTPDELKATLRKAMSHLMVERQARRLADEKRRIRFDFIRVLGHELKAPLAAIESFLGLMRDRAAGPDLAAYDHIIARSLLRASGMRKLISDLLDMTRIESGERKRELTSVDLSELLAGVLDLVRPPADERGIALTLAVEGEACLQADRGELEMVCNNLLSNAVKYNRDGGRVDVRVRGAADRIVLRVTDTGIGMTSAEAERLFKDFARIRNEKTRDIPGSGLGLSLVKKIVEAYGGGVRIESIPDVGSTFEVVLRREPGTVEHGDGARDAAAVATRN
ncbi:MAG: response regulator [Phycisphaerales bacterium]|nr:response regulator [Phycisphaerales bacterium]